MTEITVKIRVTEDGRFQTENISNDPTQAESALMLCVGALFRAGLRSDDGAIAELLTRCGDESSVKEIIQELSR